MKNMKKLTSLVLAMLMCLTLCVPALALETPDVVSDFTVVVNGNTTICTKTQVEIDEEFAMLRAKSSNDLTRGNLGESRTEYGVKQTKYAQGWPGNQPVNGWTFPTGGWVAFSDTEVFGMPEVSVTFSVGIGNFGSASINIPLGLYSTSNTNWGCNIPADRNSSYKVYVTKTLQIEPYVTYWRQSSADPWEVARQSQHVVVTNIFADAVKV